MKKVQFLLLFLSSCVVGTMTFASSNPKVDSLLRVLKTDAPGDRVEVLWGIAYELFDVDNPEALFYAARAYKEVWAGGDSLQIVKVGTTYGQLLRRMDQVKEAIAVYSRMLPISKRHNFRKYTKMLLNAQALTHMLINSNDIALSYHLESLKLRSEDGIGKEIALTLSNIGVVQCILGDYNLGIEYSKRAAELLFKTDSSGLSHAYVNIGFGFIGLKQYQQAKESFETSLRFSNVCQDQNIELEIEYGLAEVFFHVGKLDSSIAHSRKSLAIAENTKAQRFQIWNLILLSKIEMRKGDTFMCDAFLSRAESLPAISLYPQALLEVHKQRAKYFSKVSEFKRAYESLDRHLTLSESTFSDEINKRVREVHSQYAQRENMQKIESQSKILMLQDEALVRQWWLLLLGTVILALAVIIVLVLYRSNRQRRRIAEVLDQRVRERTIELGLQRDVLQHAYDEQTLIRQRISNEVIALTSTLRGLFYLSRKELPIEYCSYFNQAEATTDKIIDVVDHFRLGSELNRNNLRR